MEKKYIEERNSLWAVSDTGEPKASLTVWLLWGGKLWQVQMEKHAASSQQGP